jgi:hypothetical protein
VPKILAAIDKQKLDVRALWLTHGHLDHAGGVMELRDIAERAPGPASGKYRSSVRTSGTRRCWKICSARARCSVCAGMRNVTAGPLADRGRKGEHVGRMCSRCCTARAIRRGMSCSLITR